MVYSIYGQNSLMTEISRDCAFIQDKFTFELHI